MPDLLSTFFANNFIPHGHCYLWKPGLVWLHITSDVVTALAYYSVAVAIVYFTNERKDLPAQTVMLLVGFFFIFALCGTTHLMEVVTLWHPYLLGFRTDQSGHWCLVFLYVHLFTDSLNSSGARCAKSSPTRPYKPGTRGESPVSRRLMSS